MAKVIEFKPQTEPQTQQHVTDDYFKPDKRFYSIDGKQLSQHQMIQKAIEPVTIPGKIIKAIVSPLGYAFGLIIAVVTDIKDGTLLDWFI